MTDQLRVSSSLMYALVADPFTYTTIGCREPDTAIDCEVASESEAVAMTSNWSIGLSPVVPGCHDTARRLVLAHHSLCMDGAKGGVVLAWVVTRMGALAGPAPPASRLETVTEYVVDGCTSGTAPVVTGPETVAVKTGAVDPPVGIAVMTDDVR